MARARAPPLQPGCLPLLLPLLLLLAAAMHWPTAAAICSPPAPLPASVSIGVLVYAPLASVPLGVVRDFFALRPTTSPPASGVPYQLLNAYYQGIQMWADAMLARASVLPLTNGGSAQVQLVFINVGSGNFSGVSIKQSVSLSTACQPVEYSVNV
jgi:hypothetical protein